MSNQRRGRGTGGRIVAVSVAQFSAAGLVALVIVGVAMWIASQRVGEREAIANARTVTVLTAQNVVEPAITDALLAGDDAARTELDELLRADMVDDALDGALVRVKIWTSDGTIIYSDADELIGQVYPLGDEEREALWTGRIAAEISDLSQPENRLERGYGKLLEVYLPIHGRGDDALLFEAYYRYDDVAAGGAQLWRNFAPISLGGLVILSLIQLPLAWSLARRLRDRLREREALTWRALEASEIERRKIAGDLHDGVVQQLTGVAYALSAMARQPTPGSPAELESAATSVRESVRDLRSLVVDLAPATVQEQGLVAALDDLVRRMQHSHVTIHLEADSRADEVGPDVARVLYRVALEGLRNVVQHAGARTARLKLSVDGDRARLEVHDDGSGFDPAGLPSRAAEGHVGLRALRGVVTDAGGTFELSSAPGAGTTLRVEIGTR